MSGGREVLTIVINRKTFLKGGEGARVYGAEISPSLCIVCSQRPTCDQSTGVQSGQLKSCMVFCG